MHTLIELYNFLKKHIKSNSLSARIASFSGSTNEIFNVKECTIWHLVCGMPLLWLRIRGLDLCVAVLMRDAVNDSSEIKFLMT